MCLVALEDPGLTVFPTHRLVSGLDRERQERARRGAARATSRSPRCRSSRSRRQPGTRAARSSATSTRHRQRPLRLTLSDQAIADAALPGRSEAYRHLDTGVLEALLLKGALGLSDEDISHFNGLFYARDTEEALAMVALGRLRRRLLDAPDPGRAGARVAAAGENMPPKSTYFFPKLLTGLLFNPLA